MRVAESSGTFRRFGTFADSLARTTRIIETRLSALPIGAYLLLIVVAIGLLLLLSGDFGEGPGGL